MKFKIDLNIFIFLIIFLLTRQIEVYATIMFFAIIHELGHYFDEKHQFSSSKQFTELYKKYRTLFNQKTKKEYFAECFKEYVGGHQEKVKPFHSYMKTITQKIRQKNK